MGKKYMFCPVHNDYCMETTLTVKNLYSSTHEAVPVFHCPKCKRYYFNSNGHRSGTVATGKNASSTGESIFTTEQKVYDEKPEVKQIAKAKSSSSVHNMLTGSIWAKPANQNLHGASISSGSSVGMQTTKEVRIHSFKKNEADAKLMASFAHLLVEYPPLGSFHDINGFIKKIFPSNIDQQIIVKNVSYVGINGHVIKRVEIYNKNSGFLKKRLPEDTYIAFAGKLTGGELVIDEMRVIQNPVMKKDDSENTYVFLYDGPNHPNALWDKAQGAAEHPEDLKGELADWSAYLDWKRQLAEMRIQGIKYIGVKFDIENRQMSILAVTEGEENYRKFKKALRRNEVSAFSNVYSSDPWMFNFNHDDSAYRNEVGVELVFVSEGNHYSQQEIDESWNQLRDYLKKYPDQQENPDTRYLLGGISRNYFEPYFVELVFELSNSATEVIERNIRKTGTLSNTLKGGELWINAMNLTDYHEFEKVMTELVDYLKPTVAFSICIEAWKKEEISKQNIVNVIEIFARKNAKGSREYNCPLEVYLSLISNSDDGEWELIKKVVEKTSSKLFSYEKLKRYPQDELQPKIVRNLELLAESNISLDKKIYIFMNTTLREDAQLDKFYLVLKEKSNITLEQFLSEMRNYWLIGKIKYVTEDGFVRIIPYNVSTSRLVCFWSNDIHISAEDRTWIEPKEGEEIYFLLVLGKTYRGSGCGL